MSGDTGLARANARIESSNGGKTQTDMRVAERELAWQHQQLEGKSRRLLKGFATGDQLSHFYRHCMRFGEHR